MVREVLIEDRSVKRTPTLNSLLSHEPLDAPALYTSEDSAEEAEEPSWLWRPHTDFSHHLFLAFRVACGTTIVIAPLLVRPHSSSFIDELRARSIIMRSDIAMYLYTIYLNTGETIELAWSALAGTFLSVLNMWVLQGCFPGGYTQEGEDSEWAFWVSLADGAIFAFLLLYLDVAMNTRIFALSSFVFHLMTFLNPAKDEGFSIGFSLNFNGVEIKEFKATTIGCMLAILTSMLPWPFWAHRHAETMAERLVLLLDATWQECGRLMCSTEGDDYSRDSVSERLKTLQADLTKLGNDVTQSRWEQFCRPRSKSRRKMLTRLHSLLNMSYDDITSVWSSCLAETYGETHNRFMSLLQAHVYRLIAEAGLLLKKSTVAACAGHVGESEAEELMDLRLRTREAIVALTRGLLDAKDEMKQPAISMDLIEEHCFCLNLCTYGRVVSEFAEALVEHSRGNKPLPGQLECCACSNIGTGEQLNFAVRNFITIALGFFVGYHGYSNRFRRYDAGIACTLAILLSKYSGSAMAKNLQRIQGVVIGTVFGQLIYALLAWCTWWGYLSLMTLNFLWVWFTFFVYFHIPNFSTIACLMGVFGTTNMIGIPLPEVGCSNEEVTKDTLANSYYDIVNVCMALFLSSIVDMLFGKSAKVMAADAILAVWQTMGQAIKSILDPDNPTTRVHSSLIFGKIAATRMLGLEAAQELELISSPWRAADFNLAIDAALNLRIFLESLESTAAQGVDGGDKDPDFLLATQLASFTPIRMRLQMRIEAVEELLLAFQPYAMCRSTPTVPEKTLRWKPSMQLRAEEEELEAFLEEAATISWEASPTASFSLENDGPSQLRPQSGGASSGQEPALGAAESQLSAALLWSRFVQWSYRTFGGFLFPKKTDICNCGADWGSPIPRPELVAREDIEYGSREWRMQMFGAALYWHVATFPGEMASGADPDLLRGADVLEVGCMRGGGARYLVELTGPRRYLATDSVQEHVDTCRKLHPNVPALDFDRVDALQLAETLPRESFDFVICVQAAAAFGDLRRFVLGAERVLRPGGRLLLCDGLSRQQLGAISSGMSEAGLVQDACTDMSRAVHAAGLCRIPHGVSYTRIVARKPLEEDATAAL